MDTNGLVDNADVTPRMKAKSFSDVAKSEVAKQKKRKKKKTLGSAGPKKS